MMLVTGGRDHTPSAAEREWFLEQLRQLKPTELRHGDAAGVDRACAELAATVLPASSIRAYPADWRGHGLAAGPIRNGQMLEGADLPLVFPGGRGTVNALVHARKRKVRVAFAPMDPLTEERQRSELLERWSDLLERFRVEG